MKFLKKVLCAILVSSLFVSFLTSCSKDKKELVDPTKRNEADINAKYDELMKENSEEELCNKN